METYALPRKPYDEVVSQFIRERVRQGAFGDLEFRRGHSSTLSSM